MSLAATRAKRAPKRRELDFGSPQDGDDDAAAAQVRFPFRLRWYAAALSVVGGGWWWSGKRHAVVFHLPPRISYLTNPPPLLCIKSQRRKRAKAGKKRPRIVEGAEGGLQEGAPRQPRPRPIRMLDGSDSEEEEKEGAQERYVRYV